MISRRKFGVLCSGIALSLLLGTATALPKTSDVEKFGKSICAADHLGKEKVFVVASDIFGDETKTFTCKDDGSVYKMDRKEAQDDPGHYIYDIDSSKANGDVFDCDGKADKGMKKIALNCFPVSKETVDHRKS